MNAWWRVRGTWGMMMSLSMVFGMTCGGTVPTLPDPVESAESSATKQDATDRSDDSSKADDYPSCIYGSSSDPDGDGWGYEFGQSCHAVDDEGASAEPGSGPSTSITSVPGGGIGQSGLRGSRYCEVLLATASSPNIHVEVYNTIGLNNCPDEAWNQLDANQIKTQYGVVLAILNGPRYWMIDSFVQGELADDNTKTFGTIDMRQAASIDLPLDQATTVQVAYTPHQIQRKTTVRFDKGKSVFELVDPTGQVFDMQSYSIQKISLTQDDLETLGSRLELPEGWTYQTRTLNADLLVTAIDNLATVVQDDFANTYQLSQQ